MALGARTSRVVGMIIGQGVALVVSGIVVGLIAAFFLSRVLAGVLYGVSIHDALTLTVRVGLGNVTTAYGPRR